MSAAKSTASSLHLFLFLSVSRAVQPLRGPASIQDATHLLIQGAAASKALIWTGRGIRVPILMTGSNSASHLLNWPPSNTESILELKNEKKKTKNNLLMWTLEGFGLCCYSGLVHRKSFNQWHNLRNGNVSPTSRKLQYYSRQHIYVEWSQ